MTSYEIDFMPVGNGSKSGDAICLRYGYEGNWCIHVVDGGTKDSGEALVEHINANYGSPSFMDHVVLTHPDDDHSSGLIHVVESFEVGVLWLHRPWLYVDDLVHRFQNGNWTPDGLAKRLRADLPNVARLEEIAIQRGIPMEAPFRGAQIGEFQVLAPSFDRYLDLVPEFSRTPQAKFRAEQEPGLFGGVAELVRSATTWLMESWNVETLSEDGETSATNESSVVQIGHVADRKVLFTGDAGRAALEEAADTAGANNGNLKLSMMQVPHHGSRRNVTPSLLDRFLGETKPQGTDPSFTAVASAGESSEEHPRRQVVNAFIRRGGKVVGTKGSKLWHQFNTESRDGWSASDPYPFYNQVDK